MKCHEISALAALVGIAVELVALFLILWDVALGDWTRKQARSAASIARRVANRLRSWWPWAKPRRHVVNLASAAEASAAMSGNVKGRRGTESPPPTSFEEVGERLNQITASLNALDDAIDSRAAKLESELGARIEQARSQLAERHEEIDQRIEDETRRRFAERKREGSIFAFGVFLQGVGAFWLLFVC